MEKPGIPGSQEKSFYGKEGDRNLYKLHRGYAVTRLNGHYILFL